MTKFTMLMYIIAIVLAVFSTGYYLIILKLIMPNAVKKYGETDFRSKKWVEKAEQIRKYKFIKWNIIVIVFCASYLIWDVVKYHLIG